MTDFPGLLLVFFAVINPASLAGIAAPVANRPAATRMFMATLLAAASLLVAASVFGRSLVDFFDVAPETFRVAAGTVIATCGVRWVWGSRPWWMGESPVAGTLAGVFPVGWPMIANPAAVATVIAMSVDSSPLNAIAAAVPWVLVAALIGCGLASRWTKWLRPLSQLTGLLAVAVGVALIVDGVRAV